jgi:hypothetical protein
MRREDTKLAFVALICLIGLVLIPKILSFRVDPFSQFTPIWLYVIYRFTGIWMDKPSNRLYLIILLTFLVLILHYLVASLSS